MAEKGPQELSFNGNMRTQVMIVLAGINSFATFLPGPLNNLSHNFGLGISSGYMLFLVLYFLIPLAILVVGCLAIKAELRLIKMILPVSAKYVASG